MIFRNDNTWRTFYEMEIDIKDLSHQHLSNIHWYWELIFNEPAPKEIQDELDKRFGGIRLPYSPLISFTSEINVLFAFGYITNKMNSDIIVNGKWIGRLSYN